MERLGVAGIIDEVTGSRRADAAASVGTYLALATLNRVVAPCPELAFADWWATTAADRWVKIPAAALDHRRFWDAMDLLPGRSWARSSAGSARRWRPSSGWTCPGWCWT